MDVVAQLSSALIATALLLMPSDVIALRDPSGTWQLNRAISEEPAYEEIGFSAPPELLSPTELLVLRLTATSVTFYDPDGARRRYALSGDKQQSNLRGFQVETRAGWNGQTLRLEVKPQRGLVLIETYTIDPRTRRLILSVVPMRGRFSDTRIRYVYDALLAQ